MNKTTMNFIYNGERRLILNQKRRYIDDIRNISSEWIIYKNCSNFKFASHFKDEFYSKL